MAKKTTCPISRKDFKAHATPIAITIADKHLQVPVKIFSTGSLGWYLNNKIDVMVNGVPVTVQIGLNMTIVGSKDLPPDEAAAAPHAHGHEPHQSKPETENPPSP
jgi:hypothetical protein